ncbi:hypothetical protein FOXB_05167 [Fusarium oxysporum f. sp. conglutinans Fo5176]|uniref:Uncharacterized protein n=1 Tax=Fusarium oxysporum (strain Fo5176) TaxID=660025 RepID=F9FFI8_FUSOF|nr:hypothetical protein FOXB_05167 [Fusarium oxysporum f. sp. conglutinans Fo5176]
MQKDEKTLSLEERKILIPKIY